MSGRSGIVTLTTDFGLEDPYVGVMKGVMLGIAPSLRIVDLTHAVPPQDVLEANFALVGSYRWFPEGTVHVTVVDPGVGSGRRILCLRAHGSFFLAPDNGVLTGLLGEGGELREVKAEELFVGPRISNTFHGRDIFAPVAARLALGLEPARLGPRVDDPVIFERPEMRRLPDGSLVGAVIHVDRFGNLITNVRGDDLEALPEERRRVTFLGRDIGRPVAAYAAVPAGEPLAIVDSYGFLEIAVNGGDARSHFNASIGDPVRVG